MAGPLAKPVSPISQVLQSIGLTRDDLLRHSDQMRNFLTQHDAGPTRTFSADPPEPAGTAGGSARTRSVSRPDAPAHSRTPPPSTPVKAEPVEPPMPLRQMDSMELILERKSRQAKREKKARVKDRPPPSPSPARASFSLDAFMQSRDSRRVPDSDRSDSSGGVALQVRHVQCHVSVDDIFSARTRKIMLSRFPPSHHNMESTIETMTLSNPLRVTRRSPLSPPPCLHIDLLVDFLCSAPLSHSDAFSHRKHVRPGASCVAGRGSLHSTSRPLLQVAPPFLFSPTLFSLRDTLHEAHRQSCIITRPNGSSSR
jgi:hypothetical protein